MKIVCLLGSPRKRGNSSTIAERFCATAGQLGAEVRTFALNEMNFRGCQGCMACKTKLDHCALKDDLKEVLEAVRATDTLVMASPVYYGDVSSQLKAFIDRTYSFLVPDFHDSPSPSRLASGKKLVFVLTQGNPDEIQYADIYPKYKRFFQWYGFFESHLLRACGLQEPGAAEARQDIMKHAEETAARICR